MNPDHLQEIRSYCRDQEAFEHVQSILAAYPTYCFLQDAVFRVISQIRESLDLDVIFTTTAQSVRQLLGADRVAVFTFDPDSDYAQGHFVAEDVTPQYPSAIAANVQDHCFGEQFAQDYVQGRIQALANIHTANLTPCHVKILDQFNIKANLVIPLLQGTYLWGLLCIHQCATPRQWDATEISFAQQIAGQLSVAIQQAELLKTTRQQATTLAQTLQQLQQTQVQLIQTEKMAGLGQLVAGIAHEINNPINFIYGNLNHVGQYCQELMTLVNLYQHEYPQPTMMMQDCLEDIDLEFIQEDLPNILRSIAIGAERIQRIVLSLRNFSRLDESGLKFVDLHEGLDNTLLMLQHRLEKPPYAHHVKVIKSYAELPFVECYANQINQAFMNILNNALDALEEDQLLRSQYPEQRSDHPPTLHIQTLYLPQMAGIGAGIAIEIRDNGRGIPPEILSRIYEPFFTTKPTGSGTGLGLAISYQIIVEQHQGQLICQSTPHQGTQFRIEIPVHSIKTAPATTINHPDPQ